jgi:hypothetical protein
MCATETIMQKAEFVAQTIRHVSSPKGAAC